MNRYLRVVRNLVSSAALACLAFMAMQAHGQLSAGSAPLSGKLLLTGSSTLFPLVTEIARRFESLHPRVKIEVQSGGSGKGIADLRAGTSDIGMVSRPLLDAERGLYSFPIARDGVAIVVQRDNPVKGITARQLTDVLTGRITTWKALGGRDAPVNLVWRGKGQGSAELILEHLDLKHEQIGRHTVVVPNADAIKTVAGEPNAVTVVSVGESERSA